MIKLYSPENEVQLAILKSLFEAEGIPIFVHNDNFGSMRSGIQIELFNKKTIMVSEQDHENARAVILSFLGNIDVAEQEQATTTASYSFLDKVRMVFEGLVFGWVMPGQDGGKRKRRGRKTRKDLPDQRRAIHESPLRQTGITQNVYFRHPDLFSASQPSTKIPEPFQRSLNMRQKLFLLAMATVFIFPIASHALRCGSDLIDVGDLKQEVLVKCGTPYSKEEIGYIDQKTDGNRIYVMKIEEWIIEHPNGYYSLVFEGNRLVKIESAGKK